MSLKTFTGIVLSSAAAGEADISAVVFCLGEGKRTFIFPGLKKSKRRALTAGQPGTVVSIISRERGAGEVMTAGEFSLIKYFHETRKDLDKIACAAFLLELTERTTAFAQRDDRIFKLLSSALAALETASGSTALAAFYTVHLMRLHGILTASEETCGRFIRCALNTRFSQFSHEDWPSEEISLVILRLTDFIRDYFGISLKSLGLLTGEKRAKKNTVLTI